MAVLWRAGRRFRVVLAGPEMPNFQTFWRTYRFQSHVKRLGVLNDRQKRDFFAGIDLFALPSRSDSFGMVLLEAWVNGVPNVAYRAGGVAEIIRPEENGLLARCGDAQELADCLDRLVGNSDLRLRLGMQGRNRALREFRWRDKLERVKEIYGEVIRA